MALGLAAGHALASEGDYIVAVVNQEVVTAAELQQRIALVREEATRAKATLPPPSVLRKQALDTLIDERVLVTNARDSGSKIDAAELDRAVANIAAQNQLTMPQLRDRLRAEGIDYGKFRDSVKDKLLVERVREREVANRIKISDAEIDALIEQRLAGSGAAAQFDIAQILVSVPDGANVAVVAERRDRALGALRRVRGGEDFAVVAREISDDGNRAKGGEIGMRAADRLPDVFVKVVRPLKVGEIAPDVLRTGAGFHVLKLVDRREVGAFTVQQVHARHILLRPSAELTADAATRRLTQFKRDILAGKASFEQLARANSEDSSSEQGGDLGWSSPGQYVPEFEDAIARLDIGGISDPVTSRFGVHLIQLLERRDVTLDRKQQREQARNVLREKKFEDAYLDWVRDLRGEAYIELRDPPQ
jgi:peptidyl-prolyl cis-trans isomerase SurA